MGWTCVGGKPILVAATDLTSFAGRIVDGVLEATRNQYNWSLGSRTPMRGISPQRPNAVKVSKLSVLVPFFSLIWAPKSLLSGAGPA